METRQAHILEIAGSSPVPAIKLEYAVLAGRCSGDLRWIGSNPVSVSANINIFRRTALWKLGWCTHRGMALSVSCKASAN